MLVHMKCPRCQARPMLPNKRLSETCACSACGTLLEIDLDFNRLVLPAWKSGLGNYDYEIVHECVRKAETIGRPDCAKMFGLLDGLALVDSSRARDFLHSIEPLMERWRRAGKTFYGSLIEFSGPEEFERLIGIPEQVGHWAGFPALQTESAEAVVLIAIWKSWGNGDSFTQLAGNALVVTDPITHLRAEHSWSQGKGGADGIGKFYVFRTGEQQYLCANDTGFQWV